MLEQVAGKLREIEVALREGRMATLEVGLFERAADILTHLSASPAGDEWLPIETAPKDETDILAWCVHPNAKYAGTSASRSDWQSPVVTRWIEHNGGGWTWHGLCGQFTHWRPLPAPPAKQTGEG